MAFPEMIFIFFLALIIFGPKKLPEIGRQIGRALNELRRASNEFRSQIEAEINNLDVDNQRQILPPSPQPAGSIAATPPVIEAQAVMEPVGSAAQPPSLSEVKAPDA